MYTARDVNEKDEEMRIATMSMEKQVEEIKLTTPTALQSEVKRLRRLVGEQAILIEDLQRRATEDALTGLKNKRGFEFALGYALNDYRRYSHTGALLVVDLNDFKQINDTLGHLAGDEVLRHVATLLRENTRESDSIARPGGDEFAVILQETGRSAARAKALELEEIIRQTPCSYAGREIAVSASIGCCAFVDADQAADLFARADADMYRQKSHHKQVEAGSMAGMI
jgi:diguanylate cyclase (GGDEF)-like protein